MSSGDAPCSKTIANHQPSDSLGDPLADIATEDSASAADLETIDRWIFKATASEFAEKQVLLGEFRLLAPIARGGMGLVFKATQQPIGRDVAVKVLPFVAALDHRILKRFGIEARAAASLKHPNIVPIFSVGSQSGIHFYAMELVEGADLGSLIRAMHHQGQLHEDFPTRSIDSAPSENDEPSAAGVIRNHVQEHPYLCRWMNLRIDSPLDYFRDIVEITRQAANAIHHAHQHGVLHRDIKPGNILLDHSGKAMLTDFGLHVFPMRNR